MLKILNNSLDGIVLGQKKADFPEYDQSLYVVGLEQEHHFQPLVEEGFIPSCSSKKSPTILAKSSPPQGTA